MKAEATSHAQKGRISSGIAKAARAASLHEAMYLRLSILRGHESTYKQDMGTWFEGVLLDLEAVEGAPAPRAGVLRKGGVSTRAAWIKFNSVFKEHWKRNTPDTGKAQDKRELLTAKLRHLQRRPGLHRRKGQCRVLEEKKRGC